MESSSFLQFQLRNISDECRPLNDGLSAPMLYPLQLSFCIHRSVFIVLFARYPLMVED
jgi:hypothetical protein